MDEYEKDKLNNKCKLRYYLKTGEVENEN